MSVMMLNLIFTFLFILRLAIASCDHAWWLVIVIGIQIMIIIMSMMS